MSESELIGLHELSRRLHLPAIWLKDEADAGRIPVLKIGDRLRFNADAVEAALAARAAKTETLKGGSGDQ